MSCGGRIVEIIYKKRYTPDELEIEKCKNKTPLTYIQQLPGMGLATLNVSTEDQQKIKNIPAPSPGIISASSRGSSVQDEW